MNCNIIGSRKKMHGHKMSSHFKNLLKNKIHSCKYIEAKNTHTTKAYTVKHREQTLNGCVSISVVLLFSRREAMHQAWRSLDFETRRWRDLVNHGPGNWFSSLYLLNLAGGGVKLLSLMHTLNVILPIIQQAHLPPVFYFHVLTLGSRRYLRETPVKKEKNRKCK